MTQTPPPARPPLTPIRRFLVVIGILVMLFSGGCTLLLMIDSWGIWPIFLIFGGVPFALGLLTTWIALRLGRRAAPEP